jgi:hypothetical protein
MIFALLAGLAAGLVHVFSGPDHLAAVAPLASGGGRGRWKTGLQWGLGHTVGVLLIGGLLLAVRERLPVEAISAQSERLVGAALVLIGGWGIWCAMQLGLDPDGHTHAPAGASFATGVVHGLAGSSHLFGVLPAIALPGRLAALVYLGGFGLGAVAGMTTFAATVGLLSSSLRRRSPRGVNGLLYASSVAALIVGGVWMVR